MRKKAWSSRLYLFRAWNRISSLRRVQRTTRLFVLKKSVRLCYVGVTRAMQTLYLYAARATDRNTVHFNGTTLQFFLKKWNLFDPETMPMRRNSFGRASSFFRDGSSASECCKIRQTRTAMSSGGQNSARFRRCIVGNTSNQSANAQKPDTVRPYARQSVSSGSTRLFLPTKANQEFVSPARTTCFASANSEKELFLPLMKVRELLPVKFDTNGVRETCQASMCSA